MKNTLIFAAITGILITGCQVSGQDKNSARPSLLAENSIPKTNNLRKYEELVGNFMEINLLNRGFNGAILIARDTDIVYENYKGRIDLRKKDSIQENTAFHIASTSKTMTGLAILQLVENGQIGLDDSLHKYFPRFPYPGIRVRDLLSHRSGLPNYLNFMAKQGFHGQHRASNQDVLNTMYKKKPVRESRPNTRFSYSNTNFVLLALILEKVTGKSYPVYMKENLFDPLGMTNTYVFTPDKEKTATPSFQYNGAYWRLDFADDTYGDKNVYSTPQDLLKWSLAVNSGKVVSDSMLAIAYTPNSHEKASLHNYGLGWRMLTLPNNKTVYYHNGRWHGNNSAFAYLPDEKVTIIILGNKYNSNIYRTARKAYDIFGQYLDGEEEETEDNLIVQTGERPADMGSPRK